MAGAGAGAWTISCKFCTFHVSGETAGKVTRLSEQNSADAEWSSPEHSSRPEQRTRAAASACESKAHAFALTVTHCFRHETRAEHASRHGSKCQSICGYGWNYLHIREYTWQYTFAFPARARAHTHALAEERTHILAQGRPAEGRTHIAFPRAYTRHGRRAHGQHGTEETRRYEVHLHPPHRRLAIDKKQMPANGIAEHRTYAHSTRPIGMTHAPNGQMRIWCEDAYRAAKTAR